MTNARERTSIRLVRHASDHLPKQHHACVAWPNGHQPTHNPVFSCSTSTNRPPKHAPVPDMPVSQPQAQQA